MKPFVIIRTKLNASRILWLPLEHAATTGWLKLGGRVFFSTAPMKQNVPCTFRYLRPLCIASLGMICLRRRVFLGHILPISRRRTFRRTLCQQRRPPPSTLASNGASLRCGAGARNYVPAKMERDGQTRAQTRRASATASCTRRMVRLRRPSRSHAASSARERPQVPRSPPSRPAYERRSS